MALIRRTDSTTTPIPPNIEKGTTYGGIGTIIGTSTEDSKKKEDDNTSSSYADVITSGSEGSMVRNGSASNGSDGTGEGSALTQDQYVERYKKARQEFGVAGEDGKNKDEFRTDPPTLGNSNVEVENGKVTSRETSENGNVLTNVNGTLNKDAFNFGSDKYQINPDKTTFKLNAGGVDGVIKDAEKREDEDYENNRAKNVKELDEKVSSMQKLVNDFEQKDKEKKERFDRSERRQSALDNVMRGFEMLFNGHNVRHGGLNVKGAEDVRKEAKSERFAKYQRDRQEMREQYERAAKNGKEAVETLRKRINDEDTARYKTLKERRDKSYNDARLASLQETIEGKKASTMRTLNNIVNDKRKTDSQVQRNATSGAAQMMNAESNRMRAEKYNGGSGKGNTSQTTVHHINGSDYEVPKDISEKELLLDAAKTLGIDTKKRGIAGDVVIGTKTDAEIIREVRNHPHADKAISQAAKTINDSRKGSVSTTTASASKPAATTAKPIDSSNGTKPNTASGGAKKASNGTKASGNSGSSKDKKDVAGGGTGIWGNSINRGKKKKQQTK